MNRRKAIQSGAFLAGCGLSAGTIASIISSCGKAAPVPSGDSFLGDDNLKMLEAIVDAILPETDTPGAVTAGVHTFIDESVRNNFTEEEQQKFREGMQKISDLCQSKYSKSFVELEESEKYAIFDELAEESGGRENIFNVMKSLTCQGFFTSEIGATQVLKFDPIPGQWRGCIDYSEVGAAWAL